MKIITLKRELNNGITLIALVITIIILLILAGISIAMLTGDNGILNKATTAKEETTKASAEEKVKIAVVGSYNTEGKINKTELKKNLDNVEGIDKTTTNIKSLPSTVICDGYEVEITGSLEGGLEIGKIVTGSNKEYENNGTAVIPVGFAIVPNLDDVSEGLVISDVANDTENIGNQFVWIPVPEINDFRKIVNGIEDVFFLEPYGNESSTEVKEYNAMKDSVEKNKGFYIGRYETGKDENNKVVIKKNKPVYNQIKWGNTMTDATEGAVCLARKFAEENEYTSVTSTLCYGVQWDAIMQFIDEKYISGECNEDSYVINKNGKGNYDGSIINTGSNEAYQMKNIYDMAGNVWELTMEVLNLNVEQSLRVCRGGAFSPTSIRRKWSCWV